MPSLLGRRELLQLPFRRCVGRYKFRPECSDGDWFGVAPRQDIALRNSMAATATSHQAPWLVLQPRGLAFATALPDRGILSILTQDIERHAKLIHRVPEIETPAFRLWDSFIQLPGITWLKPASAERERKLEFQGQEPPPDALTAYNDAALGEEQRDVSNAQADEAV